MGCAVVYLVTSGLFFKARNVNPEGLVRAHWAVNPSLVLQGVSASVSQAGTRLRTHSAALLIAQAPCASPLRGNFTRISDILILPAARVTDRWKHGAFCGREGDFTWTDHLSRSAEGTWVNFMVRLSYHLALSVFFSCGNLVPALSGRRSQWTPRGKSRGLD